MLQMLSGKGTAAQAATATIPHQAEAGGPLAGIQSTIQIHFVEIRLINASASAVVGSAILAITATNLGNATTFGADCSNAMAAWSDRMVVQHTYPVKPLQATAKNTDVVVSMPAPGAGCYWQWNIAYDYT
jgi:hypothetical protein